ncbi:MAG: KH domain-containing protein [Patescibacteria group bacterium]
MEKDEKFVADVVGAIVDNPDKVKTERTIDEMGVLIKLTVDPDDMGKIIGKEGRTAKAIRTLLRVLGAKNNARVNLKIVEPEGAERPAGRQVEADVLEDVPNDVLA